MCYTFAVRKSRISLRISDFPDLFSMFSSGILCIFRNTKFKKKPEDNCRRRQQTKVLFKCHTQILMVVFVKIALKGALDFQINNDTHLIMIIILKIFINVKPKNLVRIFFGRRKISKILVDRCMAISGSACSRTHAFIFHTCGLLGCT